MFRCIGSSVAWMIFGPFGILTPKLVSVKLQPMPKMTIGLVEEVAHRLRDGEAARAEATADGPR